MVAHKAGVPARQSPSVPQQHPAEPDPDRPFARMSRGEDVELTDADVPQWIDDWLGSAGCSADELVERHRTADFANGNDRMAWLMIGVLLEEGWRGAAVRSRP